MNKKSAARKRKKRLLISTLCVAAVIVVGFTFAWLTSQSEVQNVFKASGNFKTTIVENFTPPENWQPGTTTDKVVQITNTGTVDAYTRVELVPTLTYYVGNGNTTDVNSFAAPSGDSSYVPASKEAIDAVVAEDKYDAATNPDGYIEVTSTTVLADNPLLAALDGHLTVPANVTLYVKVTEGTSSTTNGVVETGYNYDFLAYYTDSSSGEDKYYAVSVTTPVFTADSGTGSIVYTLANDLDLTLTNTTKYSYDYKTAAGQTAIDEMVTLYFYNPDDPDNPLSSPSSEWAARTVSNSDLKTTYYYYLSVLESGSSTSPLLDSVKFNDGFADEIYDATFELNVVNTSTQAIYDAANEVFTSTASGVLAGAADDTLLNDTTFTAASFTGYNSTATTSFKLEEIEGVSAETTTATP